MLMLLLLVLAMQQRRICLCPPTSAKKYIFYICVYKYWSYKYADIRGWSNKYLVSTRDGCQPFACSVCSHHTTSATVGQTMQQCVMLFKLNPKEFLLPFPWTSLDEPGPKKMETVLSAGNVISKVISGSQDVIYNDYLEKLAEQSRGATIPN